ncbi:MAG TPA: hypothetical protein PK125_03125 [Syntrophorhabdus sp.]|jgi:hypothetical protein|nr:hypothetical protein [Syntrophorhabdus sp.]HNQ45678.1 hypothetical protein [Syntrophorhabdus sp.]HPB37131.1 hypothetical protein [Syntrophorhabdus sp.]HPW35130.1 hypothetical protein [Syntrophorhabdus sp.]HQB33858.1 hypothetical protein [Syntrophorhabdus sp.]
MANEEQNKMNEEQERINGKKEGKARKASSNRNVTTEIRSKVEAEYRSEKLTRR